MNKIKLKFGLLLFSLFFIVNTFSRDVWTKEKANEWAKTIPYLSGVNYVPSTAINSIEIWSEETFDPKTIDHELSLAQSIGMNSVRIFLNDMVWEHDPEGFYKRVDHFLDICEKHSIYAMITFFTNGGHPEPKLGKQPDPIPGKHNSGWMKTPRLSVLTDESTWGYLEGYVNGTISRFANDKRIAVWDVFNEPGNVGSEHIEQNRKLTKEEIQHNILQTKKLMLKAFEWGRAANPSQPITACIWGPSNIKELFYEDQIKNSDIISYHCYDSLYEHVKIIKDLRKYERPIMCTEWMARHTGSTFIPILDFLKKNDIASYAFGLKVGKIQTELVWPALLNSGIPGVNDVWFHDIFDENDQPYSIEEIDYIKRILTSK